MRRRLSPTPHVVLIAAVALIVLGTLAWLAWRLFEQDHWLERQRVQECLESASDVVAASLLHRLSETERELGSLGTLPDADLETALLERAEALEEDSLLVVFGRQSVNAYPASRLLYHPFVPPRSDVAENVIASVVSLEFQRNDHPGAIDRLREMSRSRDTAIRAGALLRLARNLQKVQEPEAALRVYPELAGSGATVMGGAPAELLARYARCKLFDNLGRPGELAKEAELIYLDLHRGRWPMDRSAYRFYSDAAAGWLSSLPDVPVEHARVRKALAIAQAVEALRYEWQRADQRGAEGKDLRSLWLEGQPFLIVRQTAKERLIAFGAGPSQIEMQWLDAQNALLERHQVRLEVRDTAGNHVMRQPDASTHQEAVRTAGMTRLPWTLRLITADPSAQQAAVQARQRLMTAQVRSDFVAAVSHEFRTPLTSIRQLTEMLAHGRVADQERGRRYYAVLLREAQRLERLVEGLLDFGRTEAGARPYRFEKVEAATLVREVVSEFVQEIQESGRSIALDLRDSGDQIRGDRAGFSTRRFTASIRPRPFAGSWSASVSTLDFSRPRREELLAQLFNTSHSYLFWNDKDTEIEYES